MSLMSSLRLCTYLFKAKKLFEPKSWLLLICFTALTGCQSFLRPVDELEHPQSAERLATLGDESGEAELEIESMQVSRSFSVRPRMDSQPLPNDGRVLNLSISNSGYIDAMRLMLAPYSIGLLVDGNPKLMERYANVVSIKLSGTLPDVIERISKTLGFFYVYNNNVLTIMPEESFILELPPALAEDTTAGLTNTMQYLGANDVYLDRLNRTVSYKTNRTGARNIEEYLSYLRRTRSILLYDMHIYQVTLSDAKANGIRWDKLAWTAKTPTSLVNSLAISATGANSESGNIVIAADKFSMSTFVTFLNSQGSVRLISQPRMALLSGTKGNLRVGENITIVSKVGAAQGVGGTVTTVETNQIKTGFELGLFGEVHEGSVYTKVSINLSDLVKIEEKKVQGTDLTLPTISERVVNTIMRARPGDVVILGGISSKRENGDVVNNIGQSAKTESNNRSEIVIALRPRVLHFIPSGTSSSSKKDVLLPAETIRSPKLVESNRGLNSSEIRTENP